jgi:class III poly(R)-hydroxyalkanoic acid synthase PhaE subunit
MPAHFTLPAQEGTVAKPSNWMDDWLQAQQKYWNAWAGMAQRGMQPEAPANPLADGLDQWWRAVAPMTPPAGREVFDKLMEVSKSYYALAERFMQDGRSPQDGGMDAINGWLEGMQRMWTDWSKAGGAFKPDEQFKGLTTFWDLPLDTWNRLAATVMPMPGDFTQAFHPEGGLGMREQVNKFLSIPAVGYTRESQEQYQILGQRQMDYLSAMQAYQAAFGKLGMETTKSFQQALQQRAREGKSITSLRELYDQWVEMSEAAYADFVMTKEYQTLYGRLVNTLLALKHQLARMVDQTLEAMHMPTHAEIRTLQCRQQEIRRENLRLRKELHAMQQQLETIRQHLMKPATPAAGPAEPAAPTKPARPAAAPVARVAAKPAARTPVKAAAKPAAKVAAKPAAKVAAKPAAKVAAKPAAKVAAKPAAKVAAKPAAKVAAKPAAGKKTR